jgi:diguanylate cyclase (GGDEF)-like protein/PAS domain S-box-containing protein
MAEVRTTPEPEWSAAELQEICVRNLLGSTDEIIYFKDLQSRFIFLSKGWTAVHGRDPQELLGLTDFDVFDREHAAAAYADEQEIIATGLPMVNKEEKESWPDRADRWVSSTKYPLRDVRGATIGTFGVSRDVTRLVRAEAEARRNASELAASHEDLSRIEIQLRTVLDTASDAISLYDNQLRYEYVNSAAERMFNTPLRDVVGRTDRQIGRDEAFLAVWEMGLRRVLATAEGCIIDFSDGSGDDVRSFQSHLEPQLGLEGDGAIGIVSCTRDVTELVRAQNELAHQALHDPVTGLANRTLLLDRLTQALVRMERQPSQIALLFVDLDHFKEINDAYGHDVGDRLLVQVGARLKALSRRIDTVARFGGDEFVLLCDALRADDDVCTIAERVVRSLSEPFVDDGRELCISASVGVSVTADARVGSESLVRTADAAMYQAKERGRNNYQFFDADLRDRAASRYAIETQLVHALDRDEFRLEYQPVFSLTGERIVGVEALIRWDHPERGTVPPADFIGIAESRGLIVAIGAWVLNEACRQVSEWDRLEHFRMPPLTMAVNVSGRQLRDPRFADLVRSALERHELPPDRLCLEITETALIEDVDARVALEELAALGIHIALDDFGTGYSSLSHLRHFPVDVLKIDRSFVARLAIDQRERQIVAAVIAMAHVLGMTVVAEGIETVDQLRALADLGCDDGQGFLLARPLAPRAVTQLFGRTAAARIAPGRAPRPREATRLSG